MEGIDLIKNEIKRLEFMREEHLREYERLLRFHEGIIILDGELAVLRRQLGLLLAPPQAAVAGEGGNG